MMKRDGLLPCPFCGDAEDLQILNEGDLVGFECHYTCEIQKDTVGALNHTWFVNCPTCGTCGPSFFITNRDWQEQRTDEECKKKAVAAWNRRADNADCDIRKESENE